MILGYQWEAKIWVAWRLRVLSNLVHAVTQLSHHLNAIGHFMSHVAVKLRSLFSGDKIKAGTVLEETHWAVWGRNN